MGCGCQHSKPTGAPIDRSDYAVSGILPPEEPCIFCAEKHVSLAHEISLREPRYESINRQRVIGQLGAAEWHLYRDHPEACAHVRDLRHLVQSRKNDSAVFVAVVAEVGRLANDEAARLQTLSR